ncbi:MAG: aspartate aminotransferase family protein [Deltaproteobacteria bacterium]|nr:aspartate aminotransferase family protein [Deltaproteobacteria bacterium]
MSNFLMNTYKRNDITFVRGDGCYLYDTNGKPYLDCLAGIAVVASGHGNAFIAQAIADQSQKLTHVSNLFSNEPQLALAEKLVQTCGFGKVFFANSGAEANECAIKLVRKHFSPKKYKIICALGSFHGRTMASLAATGQPAKWEGFAPLLGGFVHAAFNDLTDFASKIDDQTAAIMVEPILGEFGVIPASDSFLHGLRELCDRHNLALIFDEVQTGIGRTGAWWAFQGYGVEPDIFTSAKGLANGLPIGACIAKDSFASSLTPGSHGSTFGGGAVICRAALANLDYLETNKLVAGADDKGDYFRSQLVTLPQVKEVRGRGLMIGCVLANPVAAKINELALASGLIINNTSDDVLRLVPPLIISYEQMDSAVATLNNILSEV